MPERCPPEEVIAAYVQHLAMPAERRLVEAHLTECDECGELVAFLARWPNGLPEAHEEDPQEP